MPLSQVKSFVLSPAKVAPGQRLTLMWGIKEPEIRPLDVCFLVKVRCQYGESCVPTLTFWQATQPTGFTVCRKSGLAMSPNDRNNTIDGRSFFKFSLSGLMLQQCATCLMQIHYNVKFKPHLVFFHITFGS